MTKVDEGRSAGSKDLDGGPPPVTVRYWAGARAAAGTDVEQLRGSTVGEVLSAAAAAHPLLEPVLDVATILLDGRAVARAEPIPGTVDAQAVSADGGSVATDAVLEVLPPFAGG